MEKEKTKEAWPVQAHASLALCVPNYNCRNN